MTGAGVTNTYLGLPDLALVSLPEMAAHVAAPKRCGHFVGQEVVPAQEMAQKVRAAVDARRSADTLVIARTDARARHGLDEALERAALYAEAGADVLFIEGLHSRDELLAAGRAVPGVPKVANMVEGGKTPLLPATS
ncbi:isocitrate lyase/PEP mutase family protein [Streptomyces varsoviensis]|uniref:isocitrate lyase/PEP mutase family protein n=1 Tax=Streptomyces varsoviensis TaxID=67373 RepID=UPI00068F5145|nr:isocitrate lyase/phosphoenolpyruvate mutase family protein [Streptomyces varsoviensis]